MYLLKSNPLSNSYSTTVDTARQCKKAKCLEITPLQTTVSAKCSSPCDDWGQADGLFPTALATGPFSSAVLPLKAAETELPLVVRCNTPVWELIAKDHLPPHEVGLPLQSTG